jgi:uncharacterized membrane protein (DUF4010 family)
LSEFVSNDLIQVALTLALSFLLGAEREEHRDGNPTHYMFGGIRTFPLIGLSGYILARISNDQLLPFSAGLVVLGGLLWLSYQKKLTLSSDAGLTSEVSALFTFLIGAIVFRGSFWLATALTVVALILLELKSGLEKLAKRVPAEEIYTLTRFLLLCAVILPIVPNEEFGDFHLNPHKIWLIVVAISGLSYLAYGASKLFGQRRGVIASAIFGGLYSSTMATVVLTRSAQSDSENSEPRLYAGSFLIASSLMYFRVIAFLALFSHELTGKVFRPFLALGSLGVVVGGALIWMAPQGKISASQTDATKRNPLELKTAAIFVVFFIVMTVLTQFAHEYLGKMGVFILAFLSGLYDVNPFIMSLTSPATQVSIEVAAAAVVIATASNNITKAFYIFYQCPKKIGKNAGLILGIYSVLGFIALALL